MQEYRDADRWGVIITNLGTPVAPTKTAYRAFLKEFLSDRRVVEIPRLLWWPILNLFILPNRPKTLARAYQKIWIDSQGSPLAVITQQQVKALAAELQKRFEGNETGEHAPLVIVNNPLVDTSLVNTPVVKYAMTYGKPNLKQQIKAMQDEGVSRILVIPLNPQYSASTTGPIYDQFARIIRTSRHIPDVVIHQSYFQRRDYIAALDYSVREYQHKNGAADRLLMSFHGIPQRNVELGDPYANQCRRTANLLAQSLQLQSQQWDISFQSRFGPAQWLQPYTVDVLQTWARQGVQSVQVICPGFSADCLETLEEIAVEAGQIFRLHGGKSLQLIPCLNDSDMHIQMLANIVTDYVAPPK